MKPVRYTVPRSDLRVDTYRGSGAGGQNRNKRDTGVRITHLPSGAVGEAEDQRQQAQNRATALRRMVDSRRFQAWAAMQIASMEEGYRDIERKLDAMMADENLRVEVGVDCRPGETVCDK